MLLLNDVWTTQNMYEGGKALRFGTTLFFNWHRMLFHRHLEYKYELTRLLEHF